MELPVEIWAEVERLERVRLKEDLLKELLITVVKCGDYQLGPLQVKNGKWRRNWTYEYSWINWGCARDLYQCFTAEEYTVNNVSYFRITNGQYTPFHLQPERFQLDVGIRPLSYYVNVDWHYEPDCLSRNSLFFFLSGRDLYIHNDFFILFPQKVDVLQKYTRHAVKDTIGDTVCYRSVDRPRRIVYLLFGSNVTRRDMGGDHKT